MKNKEIEIRISDLLAMLLKAAKGILCFTLILGLLGAAYGAYSVIKARPRVTQKDVETAERNVNIAESILEKAQSSLLFHSSVKIPSAEEKVARAEQTIQQLQEYFNDSIYYSLNPLCHGEAELRFTVETESAADAVNLPEDPRVGIVIAYTQMCPFDSQTIEQLRAIMGVETEPQYVSELVSVTSDKDQHVVIIKVCYDDLETADKMVNYLYETMTRKAAESLPAHKVIVLTTYKGYDADWTMKTTHTQREESLVNAEKALTNANKALQDLQNDTSAEQAAADASDALKAAQTALRNAQIGLTRNRPSMKSLAKSSIKYGILCGFIGFVFGCFYALFKGLFGGVIQNQNEVMNRYAFPLIGVLPRTKKQWFDASIRKLEGEPTGSFDATTQATAQSLLARIGEKPVCLVSTGDGAVARKLAAYTDDALPVIGSIIDNADAVKELAKFDGIVLVEERGKSRLDLVDAEVLRAEALHKDIIGIVLA